MKTTRFAQESAEQAAAEIGKPIIRWHLSRERMIALVFNASRIARPQHTKGVPLWSLVGSLTGHGCGYSTEFCIQLGMDPNSPANNPRMIED